LQQITEVGHHRSRQMRFRPADTITRLSRLGTHASRPVEPGGFDCACRSRPTRLHRAGPHFICCRARRLREGGLRAEKRCAHPARQRTPPLAHSPLLLFALLSFLFSDAAQTLNSQIIFLQFKEHFLMKIIEICCKKSYFFNSQI
jgi:hypothetical protein